MRTLLVGAAGYLGSSIARTWRRHGAGIHGLARSQEKAAQLEAEGVVPIRGDVADLGQVKALLAPFDVVIIAASLALDAEYELVSALIDGCQGADRHLLFTSGTGVLGIESKDGRWSDHVFAEDDPFPFPSLPTRTARLNTEELVRARADEHLHTTVIRPPLLYGHGGSTQIPMIFESARTTGSASYIGYGLNLYSNAHVDDVAEVFWLAAARGTPGALYHATSGEANFRSIAEAVASVVGCEALSIDFDRACEIWHPRSVEAGLAVNSRSVARRTKDELGWEPRHLDVIEDIRAGSYADRYGK